MISLGTALRLRDAGLRWEPSPGDRFTIMAPEMLDDTFVVSDMTIEVHDFPTGRVIGFNGTTEWALDSVSHDEALWLPREDQLREALGASFVLLHRHGGRWRVAVAVRDDEHLLEAESPVEAYADALLLLLASSR